MKLPNQTPPVVRHVSTAPMLQVNVAASDLPCTLCRLGCNALPEPARTVCNLACDRTVC